ncbi:MAG: hypothetical protein JNM18_09940 [Planctomycetaceae bacterium]|nr:hypothetical protein [Planctomycetaceae bacterium]
MSGPIVSSVLSQAPGAITLLAQVPESADKPVELIRARGMMAIWGLIILGLMMIVLLRLYTHAIRRRWKKPTGPSRMGPMQWQARRWRETWRKTGGGKSDGSS